MNNLPLIIQPTTCELCGKSFWQCRADKLPPRDCPRPVPPGAIMKYCRECIAKSVADGFSPDFDASEHYSRIFLLNLHHGAAAG